MINFNLTDMNKMGEKVKKKNDLKYKRFIVIFKLLRKQV